MMATATSGSMSSPSSIVSDALASSADTTTVLGWGVKEGAVFKTWHRRYFVLQRRENTHTTTKVEGPAFNKVTGAYDDIDPTHFLLYFKSPDHAEKQTPTGAVPIVKGKTVFCEIIRTINSRPSRCLEVSTPGHPRKFYISPSANATKQWLRELAVVFDVPTPGAVKQESSSSQPPNRQNLKSTEASPKPASPTPAPAEIATELVSPPHIRSKEEAQQKLTPKQPPLVSEHPDYIELEPALPLDTRVAYAAPEVCPEPAPVARTRPPPPPDPGTVAASVPRDVVEERPRLPSQLPHPDWAPPEPPSEPVQPSARPSPPPNPTRPRSVETRSVVDWIVEDKPAVNPSTTTGSIKSMLSVSSTDRYNSDSDDEDIPDHFKAELTRLSSNAASAIDSARLARAASLEKKVDRDLYDWGVPLEPRTRLETMAESDRFGFEGDGFEDYDNQFAGQPDPTYTTAEAADVAVYDSATFVKSPPFGTKAGQPKDDEIIMYDTAQLSDLPQEEYVMYDAAGDIGPEFSETVLYETAKSQPNVAVDISDVVYTIATPSETAAPSETVLYATAANEEDLNGDFDDDDDSRVYQVASKGTTADDHVYKPVQYDAAGESVSPAAEDPNIQAQAYEATKFLLGLRLASQNGRV